MSVNKPIGVVAEEQVNNELPECRQLMVTDDSDSTWYSQFLFGTNEKSSNTIVGVSKAEYLANQNLKLAKSRRLHEGGLFQRGDFKLDKKLGREIFKLVFKTHPSKQYGVSPDILAWGVQVRYLQTWHRIGSSRGRLIRCLPLAASESVEIVIKTWDKKTQKKNTVESIENDVSTEVVGDEKWMSAIKKTVVNETNSTTNAGATINNISIPTGSVSVSASGQLGISNVDVQKLNQNTERSRSYIQNVVNKAANSLKSKRSNSVETSSEFGIETTTTQKLSNPNKCHSLTYHFYEVVEEYRICTEIDKIDLAIALPLPIPDVTPEWLLCNECYLRPLLPCETLYSGFEAAREILADQKIRSTENLVKPPTNSASPLILLTGINNAIDDVLSVFGKLSGTTPNLSRSAAMQMQMANSGTLQVGRVDLHPLQVDGKEGRQLSNWIVPDNFQTEMRKLTQKLDGNNIEFEELKTQAIGLLEQVRVTVDGSQEMSSIQYMQSSDAPTLGASTYWEIVKICHIEMVDALEFLNSRNSSRVSNDPDQTLEMLESFLNQIQDLNTAFGKINVAVSLFGPGALYTALTFGLPPLGTGIILLVAAIIWALDLAGVEIFPRSYQLEQKMRHLKGQANALRSQIEARQLVAPLDADEETQASAQIRLREASERRERLAYFEVDLEKLQCHVSQRIYFYSQAIWRNWDSGQIEAIIRQYGLPAGLFESEFTGLCWSTGDHRCARCRSTQRKNQN